jgi:DNA-binding NarL/FixJ family response regulator
MMAASIRILIVDDQRLMREGLRTILELEEDFEIVGEAEDGLAAIEEYELKKPNVVLMDIRMPHMDGVEATRKIKNKWNDARVIILTTFDDDAYIFDGLRAGALGYLLKDVSGEELSEAIRAVARGDALIEPSITRKVLAEFARTPIQEFQPSETEQRLLSNREIEILKLLAQGCSNKEIAARLFLAEGTIKNYVSMILSKLNVNDRTQAALRGRELGLF